MHICMCEYVFVCVLHGESKWTHYEAKRHIANLRGFVMERIFFKHVVRVKNDNHRRSYRVYTIHKKKATLRGHVSTAINIQQGEPRNTNTTINFGSLNYWRNNKELFCHK